MEKMTREAIKRSKGGIEELQIEHFGSHNLLTYVANGKEMFSSFVRTRNQKKTEEESQKYNSKRKRKYISKVKSKKPDDDASNVNKDQAADASNVNPEQAVGAGNVNQEQVVDAWNVNREQALGHNIERMHCEEMALSGEERVCLENEMPSNLHANVEMEIDAANEVETANTTRKRRGRGPTKAKRLPLNHQNRIEIEFSELGVPIGTGSMYLSSFLGPLVREHVPYTLDDWRLLSDELEVVLCESVKARFKLEENWQKQSVFHQMGTIWRSSKSKLVRKINKAETEEEILMLKPANIKSMKEWRTFVKAKTSVEFKKRSEKFMALRKNQLLHTSGRKGMARLTDDLKKQSEDPSSITRVHVWIKSHIKKNGEPVNMDAANAIEKIKNFDGLSQSSLSQNVREDAISQVLGQDKPGRLRALGRGCTITKLTVAQSKDVQVSQCQKQMEKNVNFLKGKESSKEGSTPELINDNVCELLNWDGTSEVVAEGRVVSTDPNELVNGIRIGPNAVSIIIDCVNKPDAYLWRPTPDLSVLGKAENKLITWPTNYIKLAPRRHLYEDITCNGSGQDKKCKIYDWNEGKELVAEGRLYFSDPQQIVNGIPLGPSAIVVWVDNANNGDAYLWRPIVDMSCIGEAVGKKVAWPKSKVQVENENAATSFSGNRPNIMTKSSITPKSPVAKWVTNNKCKLIDVGQTEDVVAEGTIASTDPKSMVHCRPLGRDAVKVWVYFVRIPTAVLWRPTSELACMEDAFGTTIAWPIAKVIMENN